ncbi:MAG TPA: HdeD family acid-resistance protein [Rubrobacteraceae bacterium]|nr:HdeD family acid-resistance protein [Rubrobacteraceae bacterium]
MTQPQAALPAEAGHWWALALRGVIAILFGLAALLRPGMALVALILLFGAYALVDGIFAVVGVFGGTRSGTPRWLLLLEGVISILAGIIALIFPGLTAVALLYLVVAWAIVTGLVQIATAIRLRQEITGEWALILGGVLSVIFGLLLAVLPGVGILSLIWLIGAYAVVFGILLLITAFRVRGRDDPGGNRPSRVT